MSDSDSDGSVHSGNSMLAAPVSASAPPAPHLAFNPFAVAPAAQLPPPAPSTAPSQGSGNEEKDGDRVVKETEALYTPYVPKSAGVKHPSDLITTTTLNFATPGTLDANALHPDVLHSQALSAAQLDAIALARMAHLKNKALLIGDGTGVGKGRELAGVCLNHLKHNPSCKRFILVTASAQLEHDFRRDLKAIGWPLKGKNSLPLHSLGLCKADQRIRLTHGVLFVTYATLRQPANKVGGVVKHRSRLDQLLEWANAGGKEFDGVLAFDEVHNAKDAKTATSKAVVELQAQLDAANVVYASATAMSAVGHLCSLTRLGLWNTLPGDDTAYPNLQCFLKKWQNQTRSGLEVVSSELAAQGLYVARRLSFEGTSFRSSIASLSPEHQELHESLCRWWLKLSMIPDVLVGMRSRARLWGSHLQFFKALLVAFRVDFCAERAKHALDAGGSVVVSLIGTGEATAKRVMEEKGEDAVEDGFVALQEVMRSIIKAAEESISTPPADLLALKAEIDGFRLPPSPLDLLIHKLGQLGYGAVAEMTGRDGGFYCDATGKWSYKKRTVDNLTGCQRYQKGEARIAVISSAASTGISLHNTSSGPDHPRTQFLLELPWDAQQAMQQLGRTHRADEHNQPAYELITSDLNAEKRFAATVSKRAADLGAATTGDRRGANEEKAFGSDILIGVDAIEGLRKTFAALAYPNDWPVWCEAVGVVVAADADATQKEAARRAAWAKKSNEMRQAFRLMGINAMSQPKQILGRLLGMPFEHSNDCMHLFESACIEAHLQSAKQSTDAGVEDIVIGPITKVINESVGGAVTIATDIGVTFESALAKAQKWASEGPTSVDPKDGREKQLNRYCFCTRNDAMRGRVFNVLAQLEPPRVRITRPNGRQALYFLDEFKRSYAKVKELSKAKELWDKEYTLCLDKCSHGIGCKDPHCDFGRRYVTSTIVKMPGALNALCEYQGARQILRYTNTTDRCVAVRLGTERVSVEDKLMAEKQRQQALALKEAANKQKADAIAAAGASSASVSDSSPTARASDTGFINDDSDDEAGRSSSESESDANDTESDDEAPGPSSKAKGKRPVSSRPAAVSGKAKLAAALAESEDDDELYGPDARAPAPKKRQRISAAQAHLNESDSDESGSEEGLSFANAE